MLQCYGKLLSMNYGTRPWKMPTFTDLEGSQLHFSSPPL